MRGEAGCFVYKVLNSIGVRSTFSEADKYLLGPEKGFDYGDLISVDLIIHTNAKNNGPFMRLSDGSGWVFEKKEGCNLLYLEQVPVKKGLWSFYVDNEPIGLSPRNHPMDHLQNKERDVALKHVGRMLGPMYIVFCDRKVRGKDGVYFYRLQGSTHPSWVFDKRILGGGAPPRFMMHPESRVQTGLFAFRALGKIQIRSCANVGDEFKTSWSVKTNEIVVCDIVRECPLNLGDGPFLRLADGTGWLFEKKKGEPMMEEVPIQQGKWKLRVRNSGGIKLRKQPIDGTKSCYTGVYPENEVVVCDLKIPAVLIQSSTSFYRVQGTNGWIFDKRGDHRMAKEISADVADQLLTSPTNKGGWSVDFVRGCAAAAKRGIEEISFNTQSCIISFRHPDGARINVYYTTKTIGIALANPNQGNSQLFRRNCTQDELIEILQNPRVRTGHGYDYRASNQRARAEFVGFSFSTSGDAATKDVNIEEDFRNRLRDLDSEIEVLLEKRQTLCESIHVHECNRVKRNNVWLKQRIHHERVLEAEQEAFKEQLQQREEVQRRETQQERLQQARTCGHCGREFASASEMANHVMDVHEITCEVCDKVFYSRGAMDQHMNATGHY